MEMELVPQRSASRTKLYAAPDSSRVRAQIDMLSWYHLARAENGREVNLHQSMDHLTCAALSELGIDILKT